MYSAILLLSMAGTPDAPAFFAPTGCSGIRAAAVGRGGCRGELALVGIERTHYRVVRVHTAPKTGCSGVVPASLPLPMPPGAPVAPATPLKAAPVTNTAVVAPAPVAAVLNAPRRVLWGVRSAVCPSGLCGR